MSDDVNILVLQNQYPGVHPEFRRPAFLTPEQLREMLVTLGNSSARMLTFIAISLHEQDVRGTIGGIELRGSSSASVSCLTTNLKLKYQSHGYQERHRLAH